MIALLTLSIVTFIGYLTYVCVTIGIRPSISHSYYGLGSKQKGLFVAAIFISMFSLGFSGDTWLFFVAAMGLGFVGGSPAFERSKIEQALHRYGVLAGIAAGLTSIWIDYGQWEVVIGSLLIIPVLYYTVRNSIWWIEIFLYFVIWFSVANYHQILPILW